MPDQSSDPSMLFAASSRRAIYVGYIALTLSGLLMIAANLYHLQRPMYGLHDWARANGAWAARTQAQYGLSYTHGYKTLALGNPPREKVRYVSHPVLVTLLEGTFMKVLGTNSWSYGLPLLLLNFIMLFIFVHLLRQLTCDLHAFLAGILLACFPITGYFGYTFWSWVVAVWAFYRYLQLIGSIKGRRQRHYWELAVALLLLIQISWPGVFTCFAFGLHYLYRLLIKKDKFTWPLLLIIILAPITSTALNFFVMLSGYDWDWDRIGALLQWRLKEGEQGSFSWARWLAAIYGYACSNFTLPILIAGALYALCRICVVGLRLGKVIAKPSERESWAFHHAWFFILPGLFFTFVFKGLVWEHHYWQRPFIMLIAFTAAGALVMIFSLIKKIGGILPASLLLIIMIAGLLFASVRGTQAYFAIRWQLPRTIAFFEHLHTMVPPDKVVLSFKDLRPFQHANKPRFLRPEYAWHLDRQIIPASSLEDIKTLMAQEDCAVYIIPTVDQPPFYNRSLKGALRKMPYETLLSRLQTAPEGDKQFYQWESRQRSRMQLTEQLKQYYTYEYFENNDFDRRGNTPAYIFFLDQPLPSRRK